MESLSQPRLATFAIAGRRKDDDVQTTKGGMMRERAKILVQFGAEADQPYSGPAPTARRIEIM